MKKYDILDLTKFILSFFILAIHAYIFPYILFPWLRIAVPMYFVMSSFFLFSKIIIIGEESRKAIVRNYTIRQMKFYLFWFIALLPITVWTCHWFDYGFFHGLFNVVRCFLFSNTFPGSWFAMASVIGAWVISSAVNERNYKLWLIICSLIYVICCLWSSYFSLFSRYPIIIWACATYERFFFNPSLSFPVALFWIMIGKLFAENRINIPIILSAVMTVFRQLFYIWNGNLLLTNTSHMLSK